MLNSNSEIRLAGVVERVTYHNAENGWSVLKVSPFQEHQKIVTVIIYQAKVFAGSSMEFFGNWYHHPQHGDQFRSDRALELKPASTAALEKYLGSGLIKGVGPKTAAKIVRFFKDQTLTVFEEKIDDLLKVPGIADKKLLEIKTSWVEHKAIRDVMLFLQNYGISTLFAVKIFKTYGNEAIQIVSKNPYQLSKDIYGIGFFSADQIALKMGFEKNGEHRIEAGIKHTLSAAREEGHCYLIRNQIIEKTNELLELEEPEKIETLLELLLQKNEIKKRILISNPLRDLASNLEREEIAYYSNSIFFDELYVSQKISQYLTSSVETDLDRIRSWVEKYCEKNEMALSSQQQESVIGIARKAFSILTGGPGCGKTTTTRILVKLLQAMGKRILLAAPTGRAAQRMTEVIGIEAKTIHRLLEVDPKQGGFKKGEKNLLEMDFLIVDEASMLDINITASLLKAAPQTCQILLIGDPDQLPSVGAGNVLYDLLEAERVPRFRLTQIFRQAKESLIIQFAHQINKGQIPEIDSPIHRNELWKEKTDCIFIDAEEATRDQIKFIQKAKFAIEKTLLSGEKQMIQTGDEITGILTRENDAIRISEDLQNLLIQEFKPSENPYAPVLMIPEKFRHVDLEKFQYAKNDLEALRSVLKSVHPWSALHFGMTAVDMILRIYQKTIPSYFGEKTEIQILSPQIRGTLGTHNLNLSLQRQINPQRPETKEIKFGDRIYRVGDRVIQTRNNYDKGVFNGDIGTLLKIDLETFQCEIQFGKHSTVIYEKEDLTEISLAYAITIHKSQGSEFDVVIIPVTSQHFKMLFRNLLYTGLTRAKKLCVFVGSRKAFAMAIRQIDNRKRQTALSSLL